MIDPIIDFFSHPIFSIIGGLSTTIIGFGIVYGVCAWFYGITPIVYRFGNALRKRKIAIFSSHETYQSFRKTLKDSGVFKEKNIVWIESSNMDEAKKFSLFLVDWKSFGEAHIKEVISARQDGRTGMIIYALPASIPQEVMNDIANKSNTVVVNFKGRLLNDIVTMLVTTSYDR